MTPSWLGKKAVAGAVIGTAACVALPICAATANAQADSALPGVARVYAIASPNACTGRTISRIDIQPYPPFEPGGPSVVARVARIATELHATTRPSVIRSFLMVKVGQVCSEILLRESERILRTEPFLADASVIAVPDGDGGVAVSVTTVDEISLILDGNASARSPFLRSLRVGEQNLGGSGISLTTAWQDGFFYRDIFKARLVDYQFLGRPYQLSLQGTRNEVGGGWDAQVSHPFLTDLQRQSWSVSAGSNDGYLHFVRRQDPDLALRSVRKYGDIGAVAALGPVGHVLMLGATASREVEHTGQAPVVISRYGVLPDTSSALTGRYGDHQSTRANLLLGFRNIRFLRVTGFDAVEGAQDVRDGFQFSTLFGRGIKVSDRDERDYFMSTDVYAGAGTPSSFAAMEFMAERRRSLDAHEWDGILESGRAAWYLQPLPGYTSILGVEFSAGSKQRVPFQLTLSDRDGGLPGYRRSDLGGGQRVVARFEQRYLLGHVRQLASFAGAVFVDAGKLWAGDVPFGVNTNVKYSVGIGLLGALPPRSRRTWRVDLAIPINDRRDARRYEIRLTSHDFTRWFWREPNDIQTSRERSIPNSVYNWP